MYPHERSLVTKYADSPFVILGVNSDDDPATVRRLRSTATVTWKSFFDGGLIGGPIATRWGVRGWPTIYLIDHEGVIRAKNLRGEKLDAEIEKLVEAARTADVRPPTDTPAPPQPPVDPPTPPNR